MFRRLFGLFAGARGKLALAAVGAFAVVASAAGGAGAGGVVKVRMGGDQTSTRVVVELDASAKGKLISGAEPVREVVLALPGVDVAGDLSGSGSGLVKSWSMDEAAGGARLKLATSRDAVVKRRFLLPPGDGVTVYRYVIDLEPRAAAAKPSTQTAQRPAAPKTSARVPITPEPVKAKAIARKGKRVVVIDAGHGGKDPGATGAKGAREKDVNLAAAKALKARLERSGRYKVVMTREADVFVPLEKRVQIARKADADLFISLHADAGSEPSLRGASVYTLSEKGSDRAARRVLQGADWVKDVNLPGRDLSVNRILLDLTQRATRNRSAQFAQKLLNEVDDHTTLLRRSHRDGGFVVLLAPDVPAVLLEMGFITNRQDEALLTDPKRRGRLMDAVASAIDDHFKSDVRYASVTGAP